MDPQALIIGCLGIALGGFLKGATGVGAPVVGVPVLAMVFELPMAVAIFSVLNLLSNIWQAWAYRAAATDRGFVWGFAITGGIGAAAGSVLLATLSVGLLMLALSGVVVAYIAVRILRPGWHLSRAAGRRLGPAVGLTGGIMQGAGGISAPVSVTFLSALDLPRAEFIGTVSVYFLAMSALQVPTLAGLGILTWDRAALAVAGLAPMAAGIALGAWSARHFSKRAFDRAILVLLGVIAVKLMWDGLHV